MAKKDDKPAEVKPRRKRTPALDVDERGLLTRHHLTAAANALGIDATAAAKLTKAQWGDAIGHYQRAVKLAGHDEPQVLLDEA